MASEVVEAKINWSVLLTLQAIYEQMDWDKNGSVSFVEFKSYLSKLKKGEDFDHQEALLAFKSIDSDGSKQLTWDEFFVSSCTFQALFLARKFKILFFRTRWRKLRQIKIHRRWMTMNSPKFSMKLTTTETDTLRPERPKRHSEN